MVESRAPRACPEGRCSLRAPRPLRAGAAALVSFGTRGWRGRARKKTPSSMRARVPCASQQRCLLSLLLQSTLLGARGASECTACRCRSAHRQASLLFEQRSRCGLAVSGITPPSSGQTTAAEVVPLRQQCARRCLPLMSNVVPRVSLGKFCVVHSPLRSGASHASAAVVAAAALVVRASHAAACCGGSGGHRSTVTASGELQQVLRHCTRGAKRSKDPQVIREHRLQRVRLGANRSGSASSAGGARAACARSICSARICCMKNKHRAAPSASAASRRSGTRSCAGARHNTSIERTSKRLRLFAAAHVER
jgi:hypothetical protein